MSRRTLAISERQLGSFRLGIYPGTFVPYEIRLKSGEILSGKLAVINDNPAKAWEIDGGF